MPFVVRLGTKRTDVEPRDSRPYLLETGRALELDVWYNLISNHTSTIYIVAHFAMPCFLPTSSTALDILSPGMWPA